MIPDCLVMVKGAVSKKDLIPVLTHLAFTGEHVHGFNGHLHICAPSPEFATLPSLTVPATRLLPILESIEDETVRLAVREGVLRVTAGRFRANIPTGRIEEFPLNETPDKGRALKAPLLPMLKALRPFISEDASRSWSQTVRLDGGFAYATNNVVVIAYPIPRALQGALNTVLLPVFIIDELLRIDIEPKAVVREKDTVAFRYESGAWIRCALPATEWPNAATTLNLVHDAVKKGDMKPIPKNLAAAVAQLRPLCPDATMPVIELNDALVYTGADIATGTLGGQVEMTTAKLGSGRFHADHLALMLTRATHADFSAAPRVPWKGEDGVFGMLVGVAR